MNSFERLRFLAGVTLACSCGQVGPGSETQPPEGGSGACEGAAAEVPASAERAEEVWLSRIGAGASQTGRVCGRGAHDRVASVLCEPAAPPIRSLADLYRALRLSEPGERRTATTTHSLGLSARAVSAANPRVLVFTDSTHLTAPFMLEQAVAVSFSRGEQFAELLAVDPTTYENNLYLLKFEQCCNRTRCTPEDLLTEKIESNWTGFTLYGDADLEDTALDCRSCHRPYGPGTPKQMLMRQIIDPWMHWDDFRGGSERFLCPERPADGSEGQTVVTADGLDLLLSLEGGDGHYAGVALPELHDALGGKVLTDFLTDADLADRQSPVPEHPYEQIYFQTREVLCERFHTGTSPTWEENRSRSFAHGQPVPYYAPDILDARRRSELIADRPSVLRAAVQLDAFDLLTSFLDADVPPATGFAPRDQDSAMTIMQVACLRCHDSKTEPHLRRSRFNAEATAIDPATFREVKRRLSLPPSSAELMPPRRFSELPDWAIARVLDYWRPLCAEPGGCD